MNLEQRTVHFLVESAAEVGILRKRLELLPVELMYYCDESDPYKHIVVANEHPDLILELYVDFHGVQGVHDNRVLLRDIKSHPDWKVTPYKNKSLLLGFGTESDRQGILISYWKDGDSLTLSRTVPISFLDAVACF